MKKLFPLFLVLYGCSQPEAPPQKSAAPAADPNLILPGESLRKQLKLAPVATAAVGFVFTVAARVEVDETRVTRVGSPVLGRINTLLVREGDQVKKGQLLALLNSTGLSDAQLGFLKALSSRQLAQRAVDRAQQLLKADVIGSAEMQRREAELAEATAELDASRDQLTLLGMTPESIEELRRTRMINSVARVVAPMDGTVLDRKVTLGQMVQPEDTVFDIADLSHVWLVADVPEQNAGHLVEGIAVEAHIAAFPQRALNGKLSFVGATLNPETRTLRVRMDLANPRQQYKPAMLATMMLKEQAQPRPVVPLAAIVREGNAEAVFVEKGDGRFLLTPVSLGEEFGGLRVVIEGIAVGQTIVVDGAFHLNTERRRLALSGGQGE